MGLSLKRQADLEWALGIGLTRFYRSSFGAALDRQFAKYVNPADGHPKGGDYPGCSAPNAKPSADGLLPGDIGDSYNGSSAESDACFIPPSLMHVRAEQRSESCYEPEFADLHRFGGVSSALFRIERGMPLLVSVLMAHHGDRGSRWAAERPAEGRLLAVYPLTSTGSRWVEAIRNRLAPEELDLLRDDERIALEARDQDSHPNDVRRARLKRIDAEARTLLKFAHDAYQREVR